MRNYEKLIVLQRENKLSEKVSNGSIDTVNAVPKVNAPRAIGIKAAQDAIQLCW